MKIAARGVAARMSSLVILAVASIVATAFAQTPGKSIKDQLVGHWQLVAADLGGTEPYGASPQGSMFLDADGHYSVIVLSGGEAKNVAYFGTYAINDADSSMTFHIDGSTNATADGRDMKRLVTLSGDELITDTPPSAGRRGTVKLTWKRSQSASPK
jgi:hypothetical protein